MLLQISYKLITIIKSQANDKEVELYPDRQRKNGSPIKTVHFNFPVAYNGETVYDFPHLNQITRRRLSCWVGISWKMVEKLQKT